MGKLAFVLFVFKYLITHDKDRKAMKAAKEAGDQEKLKKLVAHTYNDVIENFCKRFDITIDVSGYENVPDCPALYVANHSGMIDAAVLAKMPGGIGIVLKKEFEKVPFLLKWLSNMNGVFIDRQNPREAVNAINQAAEIIKSGYSMGIFPEGTRTRDASVGEFKNGAFKIAQKTGCPIVPIAISGSYKLWEDPGKIIPGTIKAHILEPIYTENLDRKAIKELSAVVRQQIVDELESMNK